MISQLRKYQNALLDWRGITWLRVVCYLPLFLTVMAVAYPMIPEDGWRFPSAMGCALMIFALLLYTITTGDDRAVAKDQA